MSQNKLRAKLKILCQQDADLDDEKDCVQRYRKYYGSSEGDKKEELNDWLERTQPFGWVKKVVGLDNGEQHEKPNHSFMLCLNPNSTYQLSKKAERGCKKIGALVQEARRSFEDIPRKDQNEAVDRFEYLKPMEAVLDEILEAVQCPSINTIRVYGDSGTGKTMLVREVKRIAQKQKLFDAVVMASVKGNLTIQDEIARDLGVSNKLTDQEASNSGKLTEKKVLLILDDIWEPEIYWKLHEKLPLEDKNENRLLSYKILLITRDNRVLFDLSERQIEIKPLEEKEAWMLFKKIATYRTESCSLPFYAKEICKGCYGLPIAVATLAKALKSGKLRRKTAIQKLQSHPSLHSGFNTIYDCLQSSELQQTFLLCSLMGHNAAVQDLLKYTIGLDLFSEVKSVEEARDALLNSMAKLKYSSLLLDSGGNMHFDMHDLVMKSTEFIVLREVGLNKWQETKSIKWIFLSNTSQLPEELNSPQLSFFHLSKEDPSKPIPPDLFAGTGGLRVLGLTKTWSTPQSICLLNDLHTLRLDQSVLRDANMGAIIGKLLNLQVLSLVGCDLEELDEQIGRLAYLKLLDLSDCAKLKVIPPGVLSSLSRLEELYMRNSFDQWAQGVEEEEKKINANLFELRQLTKLTAIEIRINICNTYITKGDLFFGNLARYKIFEGDTWHSWDSYCGSSKILKLKLDGDINPEHPVKKLLKMTEELHLQGLSHVRSVVDWLDDEGFQKLKYLFIQDAGTVAYLSTKPAFPVLEVLVLHNLEYMMTIFGCFVTESCFSKLRMITVEICDELKNLFFSSLAKNLLQLREIRVTNCKNMEEIVDDEEQGSKIDNVDATKEQQKIKQQKNGRNRGH
ncbi:hypothetical protein SLE2022_056940 [Rubroshorea leprosula]